MTDSTSSGKSVSRSNASNQFQMPWISPMIRYATNVWPTLIPTSLPGRPSKIPPVTVVVIRTPNTARKPTTSPPPAAPGRPPLANRPYSRTIARISDAMKLPMSPPATPFGACFRIASMSDLGLAQDGHPHLPEHGPRIPNSPEDKVQNCRDNDGDIEVGVEERRTDSSPDRGPL